MTVIDTRLGKIKGIDHGTSLAFLGLRYGEPPIGSLRFMPPLASGPWNGVLDGTNYPNRAMQSNKIGTMGQDTPGELSEDCLFLNIYTPSVDNSKRPVMVWIHGGGNTTGAGSGYDFSKLASEQKVIVITINYRLGPFGWFYHPSLIETSSSKEDKSGNYGLLDQILALKWVKKNIKELSELRF